jgi:16S rRNA (guanine1207-N2)-methyltransferase
VELALENARANQVSDRTEILVSDGFEAIVDKQFDHVLFNPPIRAGKAVIYRLFSEAKQVLKPEGSLWIVIRKQQGAASAKRELESKYPVVEVVEQKKGYWVIRARNH